MLIHVLRSPTGGRRRTRAASTTLIEELRQLGHEAVDLTGESSAASGDRLRAAIENGGVERLLVAGGDGLVHLAIQELSGTSIPLALAPVGSGNDFAAALGIDKPSTDLVLAEPIAVDLIKVSWPESGEIRWIASIAIAGFPADINARANNLPSALGSQVYPMAAVMELPTFRRVDLSLRLDGDAIRTNSAMLAIGNTPLFGGGMLACPDAKPADGLLHLTSIEDVGRVGILRHLVSRSGGSADRPEVLRRTAVRVDLETADISIWGDGEPVGVSPVSLTIAPRALMVAGAQVT